MTDRPACAAAVEGIVAAQERLDILVCNAGICPPGAVAGDWGQWDRVIDVNVNGTQNCIAAAWDHMVSRRYGRIVLVSSMAYYQGGMIVGTEYSASKGAVAAMTRHIARNGGQHGILCNAVAPGVIATEMTASFSKPDLAAIPVRELKLDRSLVCRIEEDERARRVARLIVELGRDLGVEVLAEGIETESQAALLWQLGCSLGQGFLFGRPQPAESLHV